jgi:hypothetical protein
MLASTVSFARVVDVDGLARRGAPGAADVERSIDAGQIHKHLQ